MQQEKQKILKLKQSIENVFNKIRKTKSNLSINQFAFQYDIDKSSLNKIERGFYDCRISTALKISEACGLKFSEFAKMLEDELGDKFSLIDN